MKKAKYSILMAIAAMIWGSAFVAQRMGAEVLDAYSFNSARSFLGSFALLPVILTIGLKGAKRQFATRENKRSLLLGGLVCGLVLTVSTLFQQVGLEGTSAGKAGFITALYILIVPVLGLFTGKKVSPVLWLAVAVALWGMFRLCIKSSDMSIERSDAMVLCCAFTFSFHILAVDYFVRKVDPIVLSAMQFFFCGIFSLVPLALGAAPVPDAANILKCAFPIAYTAIFSSAIAYTLQIVSQKNLNATVASIIMSLESVFAALSGWLVLREMLSFREFTGCVLVFAATLLAQLAPPKATEKGAEPTDAITL